MFITATTADTIATAVTEPWALLLVQAPVPFSVLR